MKIEDFSALEISKIPPQNVEQEMYVLGAMMIEKEIVDDVFDIIKTPEAFYKEAHQKIAGVILKMSQKGIDIDISTVTVECKKAGILEEIGGPIYITELTGPVASAAHVRQYSTYVFDSYLKRKYIELSHNIQDQAYDEMKDIDDLMGDTSIKLNELESLSVAIKGHHISEVVKKSQQLVEDLQKGTSDLVKQTGIQSFDNTFGGFMPQHSIIIAGRPSMGKTSFAMNVARKMADHFPVGIFSLEMSEVELVNNMIASEAEMNNSVFRRKMEPHELDQYNEFSQSIVDLPIYIDDDPTLTYISLRRKARRMVKEYGVKVIFVDYLQLMRAAEKGMKREEAVSEISRNIKLIAKELNIAFISLAQLNRGVEMRTSGRPKLSDLRESGAIEQDADMVIFIHRPEMQGITQDEEGNSTKGLADIIVAKNRSGGPTGNITLRFMDYCTKFVEAGEESEMQSISDQFDFNFDD